MDTNVLSCSKCSHTVSESAEVCAYCGTAVSSDDAPSAPDVESSGVPAQAAEPAPIPEDDSAGKTEMPDVAADAEPSSQRDPEEKQMDIVEPAAEAVPGTDNQLSDVDDDIDFQFSDDEPIVELDTEEAAKIPAEAAGEEPEINAAGEPAAIPDLTSVLDEIVDTEPQAAEVIPLADKVSAKTAADDSPDLPETPVLEVSGEDTSESETLGADILELVQVEATEQESAEEQISETVIPVDDPVIEQTAESAPDETPEGSKNNDGDLDSILVAPADEDQPLKQPLSGGLEDAVETGASEKPAAKSDDSSEVIQKQAEGQASGEAIETEIADQDLAEARKKKKAAQAKALKVQKLKLAKAQALKRKKLAQAQALKKQKAAQAGIEKANTEVAAGSHAPEADTPPINTQRQDANTKMLGLLKKYEGHAIGINYDNSAAIKEAQLVEANDEFFSVFVKEKELNYRHPLKTILTIIEGKDGVETGKSEQKEKFTAVVKVYPLVLF